MFNRRFLRIKVFQQLYAFSKDKSAIYKAHERNLVKSIEKAYELYIYLLSLPVSLHEFACRQLELEQTKFFPKDSATNTLRLLSENTAIAKLVHCEFLTDETKEYKLDWGNKDEFLKSVWQEISTNSFFDSYVHNEQASFVDNRKVLNELMQILIGESDMLNSYLEEIFINWEDDQAVVSGLVLKSIDQLKPVSKDEFVFKLEKDGEDIEFMNNLFRLSIDKDEELTELIGNKTQNWEPERIAVADMLMMKLALCEILYFPYIPVKVSINEYLELAKLYSTPNSHSFINGILDKIQIDLRNQKKINKLGRGLVE